MNYNDFLTDKVDFFEILRNAVNERMNQELQKRMRAVESYWKEEVDRKNKERMQHIETIKKLNSQIEQEKQILNEQNTILTNRVRSAEDNLKKANINLVAEDFISAYNGIWNLLCGRLEELPEDASEEEKTFLRDLQDCLNEFKKMGTINILHSVCGDDYNPEVHLNNPAHNKVTNDVNLNGKVAYSIESGYSVPGQDINKEKVVLFEYKSDDDMKGSVEINTEKPNGDDCGCNINEEVDNKIDENDIERKAEIDPINNKSSNCKQEVISYIAIGTENSDKLYVVSQNDSVEIPIKENEKYLSVYRVIDAFKIEYSYIDFMKFTRRDNVKKEEIRNVTVIGCKYVAVYYSQEESHIMLDNDKKIVFCEQ